MRGMSRDHWAVLIAFLMAISMQVAGLGDSWEHATKPSFIAGLIGQLATFLGAMFMRKPSQSE